MRVNTVTDHLAKYRVEFKDMAVQLIVGKTAVSKRWSVDAAGEAALKISKWDNSSWVENRNRWRGPITRKLGRKE
jgi:hypothetical protein